MGEVTDTLGGARAAFAEHPRAAVTALPLLSAGFAVTSESLRALACYVIAPARKARTGRIGLRPTGDGFGTPPFDDGRRLVVRGTELRFDPGDGIPITTLRAAAAFAGVELSSDPGVGKDLPPFRPDDDLVVDAASSLALGGWYAFGQDVLDGLVLERGGVSESQLWPEHFDLAVTVELASGPRTNVGCSPGDGFHPEPYVYVGPHDLDGHDGVEWNAPFGAFLPHAELATAADPLTAARAFVTATLGALGRTGPEP